MMEFEIDSRVQPIGKREGQTVYFAKLKTQQKLTNEMVIERIVRETSFGRRREKRPCQPKQHRVRCSQIGHERGSRRTRLVPPHRSLQDDGHPGGSHSKRRAEDPENRLHAQAEDARCCQCGGVEYRPGQREGFHGWRHCHRAGRGRDGKSAGLRCKLIAAAPHTRLAAAFKKF